jgi:hypothetical protein
MEEYPIGLSWNSIVIDLPSPTPCLHIEAKSHKILALVSQTLLGLGHQENGLRKSNQEKFILRKEGIQV